MVRRADTKFAITIRSAILEPTIKAIASIAGPPGVSQGVTYQGEVIYRFNHGFRDVEALLTID